MKNFLTMIAAVALTTTGTSAVFTKHQDVQPFQAVEFYWNSNNSNVEYSNSYSDIGGAPVRFTFLKTINIGIFTVRDYSTASIIDPNKASYSKISWGNDAFWGDSLRKINNTKIDDIFVNQKISVANINDSNTKIALLNTKQWSGLAYMESVQRVGLSYYYENGSNYIQIYGYQSVLVYRTFSGGSIWTNIAKGIKLYR